MTFRLDSWVPTALTASVGVKSFLAVEWRAKRAGFGVVGQFSEHEMWHVEHSDRPPPLTMGRQSLSSIALLLPLLAATTHAASEPTRPRGVGPDCT